MFGFCVMKDTNPERYLLSIFLRSLTDGYGKKARLDCGSLQYQTKRQLPVKLLPQLLTDQLGPVL